VLVNEILKRPVGWITEKTRALRKCVPVLLIHHISFKGQLGIETETINIYHVSICAFSPLLTRWKYIIIQ
jgi:hypothetical protein